MALSRNDLLQTVLNKARNAYFHAKDDAQTIYDRSLTGNLRAERLYLFSDTLVDYLEKMALYRSVPGIGQFARDAYGDQAVDFNASLLALEAAANSLVDWTIANFPASVDGYLETVSFDQVTRKSVVRTLPSNALSAYRTELQAIIDA